MTGTKKPAGRPEGSGHPIDDAWKEWVRAELAKREMNQTELARALGVTHSAVSQMLSKGVKTSRLVPKIHKIFGAPAPAQGPSTSPLRGRWLALFDRLSNEEREKLMAIGEMIPKEH